MNWDLISILIFYGLLITLYLIFRKRFTVQGKIFVMYKTKLGLNLMNKIAKYFPNFQKIIAKIGIYVGFASMVFIFYMIIDQTIKFLIVPGALPAVTPVFPQTKIPGLPPLSFWHWIVSSFIVVVIHEFSHGLVARLYKIPVKSSGFAFLGPILAAFVEPEEKVMEKKKKMEQLSVLAAGPFSNIVFGVIIFLIMILAINPFFNERYDFNGISFSEVSEDYPMAISGIETPFIIYSIDGEQTPSLIEFFNKTQQLKPGDTVIFGTDKGDYTITSVENPENESLAFFGMSGVGQEVILKQEYSHLEKYENLFGWFRLFIIWLFLISVGVGLFNLLPLGPVDGGRMFFLLSLAIFKSEEKAKKILTIISLFLLFLIIINLIPWLNNQLIALVSFF